HGGGLLWQLHERPRVRPPGERRDRHLQRLRQHLRQVRRERRSRHRPVQPDAVLQLQGAGAVQPLAAGGRRMLHVLLL
ncbi:unnamed protein product, partial [Prorocentrum cordatum]